MTLDSSVRIGLLLPDVLGTYADGGNATVLAQRLRWRGVPAEVLSCPASEEPPTGCEIYLLGGGEDAAQLFAADWLRERPALCRALAGPAVTLAVCAGLQILGHTLTDAAGQPRPGAGLLDLATRPRAGRATGEITTECLLPGVGRLSGFENHRGVTTLGPDARPLGRVLRGVGNGDRGRWGRGGEGARAGRIFGTYLHGPVLARNPALADHLLTLATGSELAELEVADQAALRRQYLG
ncbi:glutamine amidotransferase [Pseudonocardia eucalypti]|uniref:Lipid II isoglutaminyl synthase (glutamine-hydrolyzing) subunit GatD n=1 Tax=Pseudonocardia eucalypti TaxID=648755 RepID=A0ABP9R8H9_9PSEU|nr:CobQ-like glutamine amidotransferase family enzyme [Pseudonocardia eucalypti]